jgi:hypothetical protein
VYCLETETQEGLSALDFRPRTLKAGTGSRRFGLKTTLNPKTMPAEAARDAGLVMEVEDDPEEAQDAALAKCESIAERIRSAAAFASAASRGQAPSAAVEVVKLEQVPLPGRLSFCAMEVYSPVVCMHGNLCAVAAAEPAGGCVILHRRPGNQALTKVK